MISKRVFIIAALLAVCATTAYAGGIGFIENNINLGGPPATSAMNINNASGIVHLDPYSKINSYIGQGYNGGGWNGLGIRSATAAGTFGVTTIGDLTGADYKSFNGPTATFYTLAVADADTIIKYTWTGDVNLDGIVDDTDLFAFGATYSDLGPTPGGYAQGDMNFDGVVDDADLFAFAGNYSDLGPTPPLSGGGVTPVPEPSTIILLVMGIAFGMLPVAKKKFYN